MTSNLVLLANRAKNLTYSTILNVSFVKDFLVTLIRIIKVIAIVSIVFILISAVILTILTCIFTAILLKFASPEFITHFPGIIEIIHSLTLDFVFHINYYPQQFSTLKGDMCRALVYYKTLPPADNPNFTVDFANLLNALGNGAGRVQGDMLAQLGN